VGEECVFDDPATLRAYAQDASRLAGRPAALVRPRREEEVVRLLRFAQQARVAVVPRGAGTSPTGSATAPSGEVLLDLSRMRRILDISTTDLVAEVEPGVLTGELQERVEALGLFYPPDPASSRTSTIGGNIATGAGGLRGFKYGVTRDYVLGLRAVLMGGEILEVGGRALKDVVGYDLVRLLVGSEGTLAVITRAVLRLIPLPPARATLLATFPTPLGAFLGADRLLASRVLPRALESLDRDVIEIVAAARGLEARPEEQSRLLVECDGTRASVEEEIAAAAQALREAGAALVRIASSPGEAQELWQERRSISSSILRLFPAKRSEDVGVPRGQLAEAVEEMKAAGRRHGIRVLAYGHAGDANLHCNLLFDPAWPGAEEAVLAAAQEIHAIVRRRGGTASGEHGVGLKKRAAMTAMLPPASRRLHFGLKRLFDPHNLLNPGKALPLEEAG
jgi:glycolate oxidase